jgi:alpha-1,3-rhamnosyltransferase
VRNDRNLGLNPTLERGFGLSSGEFVSVLASDDIILPTKLERQLVYLQSTQKDGVYANGRYLFDDGSQAPIDLGDVPRRFTDGSILRYVYTHDTRAPLLQSALFRREPLLALWPTRKQFKSDDWVTLIKLLEDYDIGFLDEPLFLYRQHHSNTYRNYRSTFPMRQEVVTKAVPAEYRREAMANLLSSQASFLRLDGRYFEALRLGLRSVWMNPSPLRLARHAARRIARARNKLRRLIGT